MANKQFYHHSYIYISVYLCNWLENHIMIHFISRTKQFFFVFLHKVLSWRERRQKQGDNNHLSGNADATQCAVVR